MYFPFLSLQERALAKVGEALGAGWSLVRDLLTLGPAGAPLSAMVARRQGAQEAFDQQLLG